MRTTEMGTKGEHEEMQRVIVIVSVRQRHFFFFLPDFHWTINARNTFQRQSVPYDVALYIWIVKWFQKLLKFCLCNCVAVVVLVVAVLCSDCHFTHAFATFSDVYVLFFRHHLYIYIFPFRFGFHRKLCCCGFHMANPCGALKRKKKLSLLYTYKYQLPKKLLQQDLAQSSYLSVCVYVCCSSASAFHRFWRKDSQIKSHHFR